MLYIILKSKIICLFHQNNNTMYFAAKYFSEYFIFIDSLEIFNFQTNGNYTNWSYTKDSAYLNEDILIKIRGNAQFEDGDNALYIFLKYKFSANRIKVKFARNDIYIHFCLLQKLNIMIYNRCFFVLC